MLSGILGIIAKLGALGPFIASAFAAAKTALGPAVYAIGKRIFYFGLTYAALALMGNLASTPFALLQTALGQIQDEIGSELMRHVFTFVPIAEMLAFLGSWVLGVSTFMGLKVALRKGRVIA